MNKSLRVCVVGLGRVGNTIALLLKELGHKIETIISRNIETASKASQQWQSSYFATLDINKWFFPIPDLLFITTPDSTIQDIAHLFATYQQDKWQDVLVFHCGGAFSSELLLPLSNLGASTSSLHPLKSFATPIKSIDELKEIYWCIEGDEKATSFATQLINLTSGKTFNVESSKKALYHAAAVMSCGHLVALLDLSLKMLNECNVSQEQAKEILLPLISGTIKNFANKAPVEALTGPFSREDNQTISHHLEALKQLPEEYSAIYSLLGRHSLVMKSQTNFS